MRVQIDKQAVQTIEKILNSGSDAVVRRRKDGVIVLAEERKIKYQSSPIVDGERQ